MAQISVREYDVKTMLGEYLGQPYMGVQIRTFEDLGKLDTQKKYVIKPDMLFGKRGKRGLLGINLDAAECETWLKKYLAKSENIDGVDGTLDVFLAEPCIAPEQEIYLSFAQSRTGDVITYSSEGGVEIEENWDKTQSVIIPVSEELTDTSLNSLLPGEIKTQNVFKQLVLKLFSFYRTHGFTSLEFNPIAQDADGNYIFLDAVAKIDDQESYLQKENWKNLEIPNSYGFKENAGEKYIRELDEQTGASLKLKILNPDARIWTLFAGGGGSLVMTDSLGALGYAKEIGNYGECSGNPSREFTKEYTQTLLTEMLGNDKIGKYLIIAGAIANFTHVDKTFAGVIDALEERQDEIKKQEVKILVRRGGINEAAGLKILEDACKRLEIPAIITGSDSYMTEILKEIKL